MKRIMTVLFVIAMAGCAGGKLSPTAQTDIDTFNKYASEFNAGVKADAPAILAIASMVPQAAPYVPLAQKAIAALDAATNAAQAVSAVATDPTAQAVIAAQQNVSAVIGAINAASGAA